MSKNIKFTQQEARSLQADINTARESIMRSHLKHEDNPSSLDTQISDIGAAIISGARKGLRESAGVASTVAHMINPPNIKVKEGTYFYILLQEEVINRETFRNMEIAASLESMFHSKWDSVDVGKAKNFLNNGYLDIITFLREVESYIVKHS